MHEDPKFFTPPRLKPLNLDLIHFDGGAGVPSQFFGKTADGRRVYCEYRYGTLFIDIAQQPGVDATENGERVLDAVIGPGMHASISWEQVCRYAGITINGWTPTTFPGVAEIDEFGLLDLSGDTTFLDMEAYCTEQTALQLYDEIGQRIPDIAGAQRISSSPRRYAVCRKGADASSWVLEFLRPAPALPTRRGSWPTQAFDAEELGQRVPFGTIRHGAFKPPFRPWRSAPLSGLAKVDGPTAFKTAVPDEPPFDRLWIRLFFPTEDETGWQIAKAIYHVFVDYCPPRRLAAFNLREKEYLPNWSSLRSRNIDRRIVEQVNALLAAERKF